MKTIEYEETEKFYQKLDEAVKNEIPVVVLFKKEKLTMESVLWKRLRQCRNWDDIKTDLENFQAGKDTPLSNVMGYAAGSISIIMLIAFIAALITGLIAYGIYKNYHVEFITKNDYGEFGIKFTRS